MSIETVNSEYALTTVFDDLDVSMRQDRIPNFEDDNDEEPYDQSLLTQPDVTNNSTESSEAQLTEIKTDLQELFKSFKIACSVAGVAPDNDLFHAVIMLSSDCVVHEDCMRWFVGGVKATQSCQIIPEMKSLMQDLREVVKMNQSAAAAIKAAVSDLFSKIMSVKNDINKSFSETRDAMIKSYKDMVDMLKVSGVTQKATPEDIGLKHLVPERTESSKAPTSQALNPAIMNNATTAVKAAAPPKTISQHKKDILMQRGLSQIARVVMTDNWLNKMFSDELYAKFITSKDPNERELVEAKLFIIITKMEKLLGAMQSQQS